MSFRRYVQVLMLEAPNEPMEPLGVFTDVEKLRRAEAAIHEDGYLGPEDKLISMFVLEDAWAFANRRATHVA